MKELTRSEMRTVSGGASTYVYCPLCNYKRKTNLITRLFSTNASVQASLLSQHTKIGRGTNKSKSVHK